MAYMPDNPLLSHAYTISLKNDDLTYIWIVILWLRMSFDKILWFLWIFPFECCDFNFWIYIFHWMFIKF